MNAIIVEKTIAWGKQRYRTDGNGNWTVLMFGTYGPEDHGIPSYRYMPIPESKVPEEVRNQS